MTTISIARKRNQSNIQNLVAILTPTQFEGEKREQSWSVHDFQINVARVCVC